MTSSTNSLLTKETVILINEMNIYKWFPPMENGKQHFLQDMKSCQSCQNLTSYNLWNILDSSAKNQTIVCPEDSWLQRSSTDDCILSGQKGETQDLQ